MSAAARKALSQRMTARWAEWRAERAKNATKARKLAGWAKRKPKQTAKHGEEKKLLN